MLIASLIFIAGLFYLLAFSIATFASSQTAREKVSYALAIAGFGIQSIAFVVRIYNTSQLPVTTSYDLLEFIAWIAVFIQIIGASFFKIGLVGIFSVLPAAILTMLPLGCPFFVQTMDTQATLKSAFNEASVHAMLAAISYALLIAGAVLSFMYIFQVKALRIKQHTYTSKMIPSLGGLERSIATLLGASVFIMFAAMIVGVVAAINSQISAYLTLKFATGTVVFALQIILFLAVATKKVCGSKLAKYEIALTIAALLLLIPIEIRSIY